MMMRQISLLLLVVLYMFSSCRNEEQNGIADNKGKEISNSTVSAEVKVIPGFQVLVSRLAMGDAVSTGPVGIGASFSKEYLLYQQIAQIATDTELNYLMNFSNPIVQAYAFMAIVERNPALAEKIFLERISDKTKFMHRRGCMGNTNHLNLFFLEQLNLTEGSTKREKYQYMVRK
jgi:hypothetical protein